MAETTRAQKAGRLAAQAIRRAWRLETGTAEIAVALRILADMPLREAVDAVARLAAVGAELQHLRAYLVRLRLRVREGEVPLGVHREEALLESVGEMLHRLVEGLEVHHGSFPLPDAGAEESGVRQTFLVEIAEERVEDCRWLLQRALEAGDAEPPDELLGRVYLRAVGEDLGDLAGYLDELAQEVGPGELRAVIAELRDGCRLIVEAIEGGLPPLAPEAERG